MFISRSNSNKGFFRVVKLGIEAEMRYRDFWLNPDLVEIHIYVLDLLHRIANRLFSSKSYEQHEISFSNPIPVIRAFSVFLDSQLVTGRLPNT
jgi:hypothetical protein